MTARCRMVKIMHKIHLPSVKIWVLVCLDKAPSGGVKRRQFNWDQHWVTKISLWENNKMSTQVYYFDFETCKKHLSNVDWLIRRENTGHWPMKRRPQYILMFSLFSASNWLRRTPKLCAMRQLTTVVVVCLLTRGLSENKGNRQMTLTELWMGTAKSENKGNRQMTLTKLWMGTTKSNWEMIAKNHGASNFHEFAHLAHCSVKA